jgi:hypothetical protein
VVGYIGAAISTIVVTYLWGVGFNLRQVTRHYDATLGQVIPAGRLLSILLVSALPAAAIVAHPYVPLGPDWCRLAVCACVYGAAVTVLLGVFGFIDWRQLPKKLSEVVQRPTQPQDTSGA